MIILTNSINLFLTSKNRAKTIEYYYLFYNKFYKFDQIPHGKVATHKFDYHFINTNIHYYSLDIASKKFEISKAI